MRASLGLAWAQAATMCTQVVGKPPLVGHERGAPRARNSFQFPLRALVSRRDSDSACVFALRLRSLRSHTPRLCSFAVC